jgi:hypothetical protein
LALVGVCSAANWQTVTTFTGQGQQTTDYFNIPTTEWKITWNCVPQDESFVFGVFVYAKGEAPAYVTLVFTDNETSGVTYVHEGAKDYYLFITTANLYYNIKIEYDSSAIPEYSTIAIIITLALVSMSVIAVRKKLKKPDTEYLLGFFG